MGGFYELLDRPLRGPARPLLVLLAALLALSFLAPLWKITLRAPQYPDGLFLTIYSYKLEGGNKGQHLQEINNLNHYIGMKTLDRAELKDLDWLPFALGALVLLTLRLAAVGNVRSLVDLTVVTLYVGGFSLARFYYKLYAYGHDLSPEAPMKIEPFTPAVLGTRQIANFTTSSYPAAGSYLVVAFGVGLVAVLAWHLFGRRRHAAEVRAPVRREVPAGATAS